jgi:hypothetical protein
MAHMTRLRPFRVLAIAALAALFVQAQSPPSVDALSWLAGAWQGKIGQADNEEHWLPPKGGAMLGVSRTVARGRMVMFEFLRIEQRPDGVFYVAQPRGRPPVDFKMTRSTESEVVFENPQHDHPKLISYRREPNGSLTARVEGDEKGKHVVQEFRFERAK